MGFRKLGDPLFSKGIADRFELGKRSTAGSAPAFNPLTDVTIPRIFWGEADGLLYKDAAKTQLATANNDLVYVASSNGQDFIQATSGNRPKFKTNLIGSTPALFFDGVDDFLNTAAFASGIGFGPYTLFLSVLANVGGAQIGMLGRGTYDPTYVIKSTGVVALYASGDNPYNYVMDANPHVLTFRRAITGDHTRLFVDGVLDSADPNADVANWTSASVSLGCIDGAGLQPFSGYIFGWGLFLGAMTDTERAGCEGYLLKKLV